MGRAVVVHELSDDLGKGDHSEPGARCSGQRGTRRDAQTSSRAVSFCLCSGSLAPQVQGKTSKTTGNAGARLACGVIGTSA